jgi:hypothetical protein
MQSTQGIKPIPFFTLLVLLAGCTHPYVVAPLTPMPSLLHFIDSNCVAPCWKGIIPGETDEASAVSLVTAVGHEPVIVRGRASIVIDTKTYEYATYFYRLNKGDTLDLARKMVRLYVFKSDRKDRPSLDNIVQAFGAPDLICSMSVTVPDTAPVMRHTLYTWKECGFRPM